jgi:hypothetical protein
MSTTPEAAGTTTEKKPKKGRNSHGQFTKGNKGGPGNPFARQVGQLRSSLIHSTTREEVIRVGDVLKEKALGGDVAAIKLFFYYLIGRPADVVDPDRMDIDEWEKLKEIAVDAHETEDMVQQCPAVVACELVKLQWPAELEQNLRESADETAAIEAEIEEDERRMEQLEAAEDEARRQRAKEVADPCPAQDAHSAPDSRLASPRQRKKSAAPISGERQRKSPSTDRSNGTSPEERPDQAAPSAGDLLISQLSQRLGQRLGGEEAMTRLDSPSTNGDKTATDERG